MRMNLPSRSALAHADDDAVLDRDGRRAGLRVDAHSAARAVAGDGHRGVRAGDAGAGGVQAAGVHRVAGDREAAERQAGERGDDLVGQAADRLGAAEHVVDVPVGVVVGPDRAPEAVAGARGLEVASGGEDRVDRVVGILAAVAVGVDSVHLPGRGHELHPADCAGRADVEIAPVVGLDAVDRGEDLPAHAVLDARGLVERKQEGRDLEAVEQDVRDRARRRRRGEHQRAVVDGRGVDAAGVVLRVAALVVA